MSVSFTSLAICCADAALFAKIVATAALFALMACNLPRTSRRKRASRRAKARERRRLWKKGTIFVVMILAFCGLGALCGQLVAVHMARTTMEKSEPERESALIEYTGWIEPDEEATQYSSLRPERESDAPESGRLRFVAPIAPGVEWLAPEELATREAEE